EKTCANAAGLRQLQAQIPQILAANRAGEPRQRGAADLGARGQLVEAGAGAERNVAENQSGDAAFTRAERILASADLVKDVHSDHLGQAEG
nr:hypothetical protein [Tanacetum cinerariifolium]